MSKRTLLIVLALFGLAVLIAAPDALAAAGGGSAGFGGGGGGGGGRGVGLYILIQILVRIAILGHGLGALVLIGLIIAAVIIMHFAPRATSFTSATSSRGRSHRRRTAERERRVELAAAEAAEDDAAFAPDVVKPAAIRLFEEIQTAWDAADRNTLDRLVAPRLAREWHRRLDDLERRGWRNRVKQLGEPTAQYVSLDAPEGNVVVRIEAKLRDYVEDGFGNHLKRSGRLAETTRIREYWTLARAGGRWVLASIEQGAEGEHALHGQIVATPWSDDQQLRDEALVERAVQDAVPATASIAELADLEFDGNARAAALDLSLADGRFAPDVLEVAARRAVTAWAAAIDGDDEALRRIAQPQAITELLHPGDASQRTRLVIRGPHLERIEIAELDAAAKPPTMTIALQITGRRYIEDRDTTAILAGTADRAIRFTERWTFALDGDADQPWRIAGLGARRAGM